MKNLLQNNHEANPYGIGMKAILKPFNAHLMRWYNDDNPEHYNQNFYTATAPLTREDIATALDHHKQIGAHHLLLKTQGPLDDKIVEEFELEADHTYIMALQDKSKSKDWKTNECIVVKDIGNADIFDVFYEHAVSACPEKYREQVAISMSEALNECKTHPEYRWFAAYKDGKVVGDCYALCYNGVLELDDLSVDKEHRKQYIATTIMKYIADHFDEVIYLHAAVNKTPKDMYAKMGFEILETSYEYFKEWE